MTLPIFVVFATTFLHSISSTQQMKILTAKSSSITWVNSLSDDFWIEEEKQGLVARERRDILSSKDVRMAVERHNALRRQEGASDMQFMTWNNYLAEMAADWADGCSFSHGQPSRRPDTMSYNPVGQNLYAVSGTILNVSAAIQDWYNEKDFYDYDTSNCQKDEQCGHYTQVVWAKSRQVGCASSFCSALQSTNLRNAYYLVCNYGPAGNYQNQKPYKKGPKCSACEGGVGWCTDGLCNSACSQQDSDCQCGSICYNCGKLNRSTCKCTCADGWYGEDCTVVCRNIDRRCNANPGWPVSWCSIEDRKYVRENCPAMCGLCKQVDNVEAGQCSPDKSSSSFRLRSVAILTSLVVVLQLLHLCII